MLFCNNNASCVTVFVLQKKTRQAEEERHTQIICSHVWNNAEEEGIFLGFRALLLGPNIVSVEPLNEWLNVWYLSWIFLGDKEL